jgi:hypothetical protein
MRVSEVPDLACMLCDFVAPTEIHLLFHVKNTHPKEWAEANGPHRRKRP